MGGDERHLMKLPTMGTTDPTAMLQAVRNLAKAQNAKEQSPEVVSTLVASIGTTLDEMKTLLHTQHDAAQNQLDAQFDEIGACAASESHGTGAISDLAGEVAAAEQCRADRAAAEAAQEETCNAWTTHAVQTRNARPECLTNTATAAEILANFHELQAFLADELPILDERNAACNDAIVFSSSEDERCEAVETEFDGSFCQHQQSCAFLHGCNNHEVEVLNALHEDAAWAMNARKDQFRTIAQVECLLTLITTAIQDNATASDDDLETCDGDVSVETLVLTMQEPATLAPCPAHTAEDPECPSFNMPAMWDNGVGVGGSGIHVGQLNVGPNLRAPPDGNWQLAMNLDTGDGNALHYANAEFWEGAAVLGGATSDSSAALSQDYKNPDVFNAEGLEKVMIVVHDEGELLGWRTWNTNGAHGSLREYFAAANTCSGGSFSHGNSVALATSSIDAEVGTLDSHEPMVVQGNVGTLWVNAGDGDNNRLSPTRNPGGNYGWGLGTAYDQGGNPCAQTMRPQADAELRADVHHWGSAGGIGGLIGTDHVCGGDNGGVASCPQGRCGSCPWTVPSGLNYDYAIFVSGPEAAAPVGGGGGGNSNAVPLDGLVAWYSIDNFDASSGTWSDKSGNSLNAQVTSGALTLVQEEGGPALHGTTSTQIEFGDVIPSTFTVAGVTRYTGGTRQRILNGHGANWLHGHWGSRTCVAHYNGWITSHSTYDGQDDWHVMIGQNSPNGIMRCDGNDVRQSSHQGSSATGLHINRGGEVSDFAVREVITWNRALSEAEIDAVSEYLR